MLNKNSFLLQGKGKLPFPMLPSVDMMNLKSMELIEVKKESAEFLHTKNHEELLFVIGGNGGLIVNAESSLIKAGDMISVPQNSIRSLANIEEQPLQVISMRF